MKGEGGLGVLPLPSLDHRQNRSCTQDQVRVELGRIAFFDPRGLFDPKAGELLDLPKLPAGVAAAVSLVEITHNAEGERVTKVRLVSKIEAASRDERGQVANREAGARA